MTLIEQDVYARLNVAGVTAIVGTDIDPLPGDLDATKPYVTYQRISTIPVLGLEGNQDFATYRFQITSVARTYLETKQLANAVRTAMDSTSNATVMDNEFDRVDEDAGLSIVQDYLIYRQLSV